MAAERVLLGTHDRNYLMFFDRFQPSDSLAKEVRSFKASVLNFPFLVTSRIVGSCPQFSSEKCIPDLVLLQGSTNCFLVELRGKPTHWNRTDVGNRTHAVEQQQFKEAICAVT